MFLASTCTCAVYVNNVQTIPALAKNMADFSENRLGQNWLELDLCMYLLCDIGFLRVFIWFVLSARQAREAWRGKPQEIGMRAVQIAMQGEEGSKMRKQKVGPWMAKPPQKFYECAPLFFLSFHALKKCCEKWFSFSRSTCGLIDSCSNQLSIEKD